MYENNKQYFAFNIWDIGSIQAVIDAAVGCACDVILQTSSRVFEKMDVETIRFFTTYYGKKQGINAYLHLDHCSKMNILYQAVESGWDSVMIDASHLPLSENIELTNQICRYAHEKGVLVEAEVGQIQGVEDDISAEYEGIADMDDIKSFLQRTHIDMLAAAIGTCHGLYKKKPYIHYEMIREIGALTEIPFVVHGGSGLQDETLIKLLGYENVKKINISTELKYAFLRGVREAEEGVGVLKKENVDPMTMQGKIYASLRAVAESKMRLLGYKKSVDAIP